MRSFSCPARNISDREPGHWRNAHCRDQSQIGVLGDAFGLTGLYQGLHIGHRDAMGPAAGPSMVFLYRRPILDEWAEHGEITLEELVTHVLVHEIGHHFGLSDADIDAIEASAG